jgi:hypothetical protein
MSQQVPQYWEAEDFSEGLAAVQVGGRWGYIDRAGRFAIEPIYGGATSFYDGKAAVAEGDKCWYIDKSGRKVGECPPRPCNRREGWRRRKSADSGATLTARAGW